ncbi:MAG: RCC1 repeat-containing protein, partial [Hymenobacter sp.]
MRSLYSLLNGLLAWLVLAPLASQAGPLPTRRLPATGQVAGSFYHSLLVRPDGSLYAWGGNGYGTLGNGTTTDSRTPVPVSQGLAPAGTRYVQVATGNTHSLALAADGTVYAWGRNKYGQLAGIHTFNYTPEPILPGAAPASTRYVQVAAGGDYSLGLTAEGTLYGWGHNIYGELGTGTIDAASAPVAVSQGAIPAGTRFVQVAAGTQHSLALAADGTLYAWGYNTSGQLGNGTISASSLTPVAVSQGTTRFVQIAAGAAHTLALAADGTLYAWGYNNMGQLGTGSTTDSKVPVAVSLGAAPVGTRFVQVSAGAYHSLAQAADGTLYSWGSNKDSQLGTGTTTNSLTPVAVSQGTTRFGQVVAGSASSLALAADGTVYVWGQNLYGQLGTGTTINSPTPVALAIPRATGYVQATAGGAHSLALLDNGSLYAWGTNSEGELGNNSTTQSLAAVAVSQGAIPAGTRFKQVSGGSFNSLALAADGTAYAWGFNNYGQLGNGTTTQSTVPVAVSQGAAPAGTRYVQLSAGLNFAYGLAADGTLYAWGYNTYGQLGTGTTTHSPAPVAVSQGAAPAGTRYVQVSGGGGHALALAADGTLYAWGYNNGGQLGNNSTAQRNAPVAVSQGAAPAGTRYVQVATGNNHSLALAADG